MNLKFIFKGVVAFTLAVSLITGVYAISTFAQSTEDLSEANENDNENDNEIAPFDMDIARGNYTGTQFFAKHKLSKSNGKNVNFYVNNTGKVAVKITINGDYAATIQPGKQGHITAPIGFFNKSYEFKAVPTPNGGQISVTFGIAQRDA